MFNTIKSLIYSHFMPFPGKDPKGPTPKTGEEVKLTQEQARRIFRDIMNKVKKDLRFPINHPPQLKHNSERDGIMVLFDEVLKRITSFMTTSQIYSPERAQTPEIAQMLCEPKSRIAVCVAFLYHACSHQEVGAAVKSDLRGRPNLKFIIKDIIDFFGGGKFNDLNVESITIDDNSYKVVIKLKLLPKEIEYSLDW